MNKEKWKKIFDTAFVCLTILSLLAGMGYMTYLQVTNYTEARGAVRDRTTRLKCYSGERILFYGIVRGSPEDIYCPQSRAWIFTDARTGERHVLTGHCDAKEIK